MLLRNIELGTKVEDWFNCKKSGDYIVAIIPSSDGNEPGRYALVNLNGKGLGNGYFTTIKSLEEVIRNDNSWRIVSD